MLISPFKPRLLLRVVWNTEFSAGKDLARHVFSRLCRNSERPASRGLGIPVYFHSGLTPAEAKLPDALELDAAETTVVIALLDTSIRADQAWRDSVRDIERQIAGHGRRHLFLPIACEDRVLTVVDKANCILLYKAEPDQRPEKLVSEITHELARLLLGKAGEFRRRISESLRKATHPSSCS